VAASSAIRVLCRKTIGDENTMMVMTPALAAASKAQSKSSGLRTSRDCSGRVVWWSQGIAVDRQQRDGTGRGGTLGSTMPRPWTSTAGFGATGPCSYNS